MREADRFPRCLPAPKLIAYLREPQNRRHPRLEKDTLHARESFNHFIRHSSPKRLRRNTPSQTVPATFLPFLCVPPFLRLGIRGVSRYNFGGIANLSILEPTAGRDALTTAAFFLQLIQSVITGIEQHVSLGMMEKLLVRLDNISRSNQKTSLVILAGARYLLSSFQTRHCVSN